MKVSSWCQLLSRMERLRPALALALFLSHFPFLSCLGLRVMRWVGRSSSMMIFVCFWSTILRLVGWVKFWRISAICWCFLAGFILV